MLFVWFIQMILAFPIQKYFLGISSKVYIAKKKKAFRKKSHLKIKKKFERNYSISENFRETYTIFFSHKSLNFKKLCIMVAKKNNLY